MQINSIDHLDCDKKYNRIISLVPSITELLVDLELEAELVGITKFCTNPIYLKKTKTIIGGTKEIKYDKIKELNPDLIITNKEENTKEIVEKLSTDYALYLTDIKNLEDNRIMISQLGKLFKKNMRARLLNEQIEFARKDFQEFIKGKASLKAAYFIWAKPWMVAASNTFIDAMLKESNFKNMYGNLERYPVVEIKKFRLQGDGEIVLLPDEPFPFKDEHAFELGRFTHHAKTLFVDGSYFSWYGSRPKKAFAYFKEVHKSLL